MTLRGNKIKGAKWETDVATYLTRRLNQPIERRHLMGFDDCGDMAGWAKRVVECKNEKAFQPGVWVKELAREIAAAVRRFGTDHRGVVFIRRRGATLADGSTDVGEGYALLKIKDYVDLEIERSGV